MIRNPYIFEGQVVSTEDPDQMGRVKVWVAALDGENYEIDQLPWAEYATILGGFTVEMPAGEDSVHNNSHAAYGMWAIPKMGATVYIFCLGGDPSRRVYFASSLRLHRNRSLPAGRNVDGFGKPGPWGDAGDGNGALIPIEPAFSNLRDQFQNKVTDSEAITRGAYERMVAQPLFDKDGKEGYGATPLAGEKYLDPQTYCFVTPGRQAIIFQDDPRFARTRIKTAEGHQVILDDANERIYVSTAKGKSWIEMDLDGHVHIFGNSSVSVRSGKDINFTADGNINLEAGKGFNLKARGGDIRMATAKQLHIQAVGAAFIAACGDLHLNGETSIKIMSAKDTDVKVGGDFTVNAERGIDLKYGEKLRLDGMMVHLSGAGSRTAKEAECPKQPDGPSIVPGHEPWRRPAGEGQRGKNWKA